MAAYVSMVAVQAVQASAAAEAERKANSSKARLELEEQMKERYIQQQQQQVHYLHLQPPVMVPFVLFCQVCAGALDSDHSTLRR